jgi:hypothetical protein
MVQQLISQDYRNVELWVAGEPEARGFVTRVELVEHELETREALVNILGRMVHAVIVIPEGA